MVVAYHCQYEIAKYQLNLGSDINAKNYNETTVTIYAKEDLLSTGDERLFKFHFNMGANPYIKDNSGKDLFGYIDKPLRVIVESITK